MCNNCELKDLKDSFEAEKLKNENLKSNLFELARYVKFCLEHLTTEQAHTELKAREYADDIRYSIIMENFEFEEKGD
jgi:hypothetical protein